MKIYYNDVFLYSKQTSLAEWNKIIMRSKYCSINAGHFAFINTLQTRYMISAPSDDARSYIDFSRHAIL